MDSPTGAEVQETVQTEEPRGDSPTSTLQEEQTSTAAPETSSTTDTTDTSGTAEAEAIDEELAAIEETGAGEEGEEDADNQGAQDGGDDQLDDLDKQIQQKIREILSGDTTSMTMKKVKKALRKQFNKKVIKAKSTMWKEFVNQEVRRIQEEQAEEEQEEEDDQDQEQDDEDQEEDVVAESESEEERPKKKKKKKKDGSSRKKKVKGPKKPANAFFLFRAEVADQVKADNPHAKMAEQTKIVGEMWRALSSEEQGVYSKQAKQDRRRYEQELQQLQEEDPDAYESYMASSKRKRADKADSSSKKKRKRNAAGSDSEGGEIKSDKEAAPKSYIEKVEAELKYRKRTKKDMNDQQQLDLVKYFVLRMNLVADKDEKAHLNKEPAIYKMQFLDQVLEQCRKVHLQEYLLDAGLLKAIAKWLTPLDRDGFPNVKLRVSLYKLLDTLPIDQDALLDSDGLGKLIMSCFRHPKESTENKRLLQNLVQKWARPMFGISTNYKKLAEYEQEDKSSIVNRKRILSANNEGYTKFIKSSRAKIPKPEVFDYVRRPASTISLDEEDERDMMRASGKKAEGRNNRLAKIMQSHSRSKSSLPDQNLSKLGLELKVAKG
mmetsp:Transcript_12181/g.17355  ORF Transcript_12181/g.17355 Transcript_12181/m.17355 type:complete len:605 (-) Transcript_12181:148-1962(-)